MGLHDRARARRLQSRPGFAQSPTGRASDAASVADALHAIDWPKAARRVLLYPDLARPRRTATKQATTAKGHRTVATARTIFISSAPTSPLCVLTSSKAGIPE